ncbi:MAG: hypothetical protein RI897_997 [Verrucomicrobiota bacterium]
MSLGSEGNRFAFELFCSGDVNVMIALLTLPELVVIVFLAALTVVCMRTSRRGSKKD